MGQPLLQKIVQVACLKTWMECLGDLRFTWFLPIVDYNNVLNRPKTRS
jgi:hypothetical protein